MCARSGASGEKQEHRNHGGSRPHARPGTRSQEMRFCDDFSHAGHGTCMHYGPPAHTRRGARACARACARHATRALPTRSSPPTFSLPASKTSPAVSYHEAHGLAAALPSPVPNLIALIIGSLIALSFAVALHLCAFAVCGIPRQPAAPLPGPSRCPIAIPLVRLAPSFPL